MKVQYILLILLLIIPILGILAGAIFKPWLDHQRRRLELEAELSREQAGLKSAETERLEQRLQVLERIVTDRGHALDAEIDALRLPSRPTDPA